MNGHVGAWAPRQPQWQHWGEEAARRHDSESGPWQAALEGASVVCACADACGCDGDATERAGVEIAEDCACIVVRG